ncbi:MAG: hypothetical protein CL693_00120 [Cellvibrionaceae bacterium]|nr:hypothetical protein [Cellvibrionaceae bacterium]
MTKGDVPSSLDRFGTPLFLFLLGAGALVWFIYRVFTLFSNGSSPVITFDKGSYYMLGVGVGLLALSYMIIREYWLRRPLSNKRSTFFSRVAISGVILAFLFPHVAHFAADRYLEEHGYSICEEGSHQWLFFRDIVYVQSSIECSAELKSTY